jgi:hypothetical protein
MSVASTRRWSSAAGSRPSFEKIEPTWVSTVFGETNSRSQIAWFERPSAISPRISRSRPVSASSAPRPQVRDAVLEQVPDPLGAALQQRDRVPGLDVLREHQDAHAWMLGADPLRGEQALARVGRRHPDVGHHDVRRLPLHHREQLLGVAGLTRDHEAALALLMLALAWSYAAADDGLTNLLLLAGGAVLLPCWLLWTSARTRAARPSDG